MSEVNEKYKGGDQEWQSQYGRNDPKLAMNGALTVINLNHSRKTEW